MKTQAQKHKTKQKHDAAVKNQSPQTKKNKHGRHGLKKREKNLLDPGHARYQKGYEAGFKTGIISAGEDHDRFLLQLLEKTTARDIKGTIRAYMARSAASHAS